MDPRHCESPRAKIVCLSFQKGHVFFFSPFFVLFLFNPLVVLCMAKCQGKGQRLTEMKLLFAAFFPPNIVFLLKEFFKHSQSG